MATKSEQKFVVKKVKPGRKQGDKNFFMEVGRLTIRESDAGKITGSLYLHMLDGDYAIFPVEPKEKPEGEAPQE